MLADIVFAALSSERFKVSAANGTLRQWREVAKSHGAEVVITSFPTGSLVAEGTDLLCETPQLRVIALRQDGADAVLLQFKLRVDGLGELSPEQLAATVESSARPRDFGRVGG
ncbi:MAG: hypothetical protein JST93_01980 [Acidobacteria bacterium]|nr:hypothetical protein [Acidobacteriota bacterium]